MPHFWFALCLVFHFRLNENSLQPDIVADIEHVNEVHMKEFFNPLYEKDRRSKEFVNPLYQDHGISFDMM